MKFIPDGAKLRITPETDLETRWVDSMKESSRRVKPGSERFVVRAFQAWCHGTVPRAQAKAQSEAKARKDGARRSAIASKIAEIVSWASRLAHDLDFREGLCGREEVGPLTSLANQLAQLAGIPGPALAGTPWTAKPQAILDWVDCEF